MSMRPLTDQNFYEILDVAPDASPQGIERAYRIARSTYQPSSAATYSIFSEEDNAEILRRVEEAYAVLSDARRRREYDARLRREGRIEARPAAPPAREAPEPPPVRRPRPPRPLADLDLDEPIEPPDGIYDGPVLRRIRMSRGIELEEISALTKVNEFTLQLIEANRYDELPAPVYLRGFVKEFARCLRLDPQQVADSYMKRYQRRAEGRG
ncbi:MAG: helix-turn-helix domain-containing protein [Myxococcota bacterium]